MGLYKIQSGFTITDDIGHIYISTGSAINSETNVVKQFIKTSFPKIEGQNNIYINSAGDLYNTKTPSIVDCLVVSVNIENSVIVKELTTGGTSINSGQTSGINTDINFITKLIDKKLTELDINITGRDAYKTCVESSVILYDNIKNVHFTFSKYEIEGDLISLIINAFDEDIEVFGHINIIGTRIEFTCDFDATNMSSRVTYLRKTI